MTELDAQLARRKLASIARNLDLLAAVEPLSLEAYRSERGVTRQRASPPVLLAGPHPCPSLHEVERGNYDCPFVPPLRMAERGTGGEVGEGDRG